MSVTEHKGGCDIQFGPGRCNCGTETTFTPDQVQAIVAAKLREAAESIRKRAAQWATYPDPTATAASTDIHAELKNEALTILALIDKPMNEALDEQLKQAREETAFKFIAADKEALDHELEVKVQPYKWAIVELWDEAQNVYATYSAGDKDMDALLKLRDCLLQTEKVAQDDALLEKYEIQKEGVLDHEKRKAEAKAYRRCAESIKATFAPMGAQAKGVGDLFESWVHEALLLPVSSEAKL